MKKFFKYLPIAALGFVACEPELENQIEDGKVYTAGEADFTNFVAVGNSLTAGFADGALYITGQENSYPNILAQQFALVGGGDFNQPLMLDNLGGMVLSQDDILSNRFVLSVDENGNPAPKILEGTPISTVGDNLSGAFNNMGVPGAKSFHLLEPGYGNPLNLPNANPYFARFASTPDATVIADAVAQNPTFFTLWIGNNDILSYATSGGSGMDQTGNLDVTTYGPNDITDPNVFAASYAALTTQLVETGAKGALINLPDVTSIPFFTTVPYAPLSPANEDFGPQIPVLNAQFAGLNQAFAFLGMPERSIVFADDAASAVVIKDESLVDISAQLTAVLQGGGLDPFTAALFGSQYGQARQATADDLLLLTSAGVIATPNTDRIAALVGLGVPEAQAIQLSINGITFPLEDQWVLTSDEVSTIDSAAAQYNATIANLAQANGLALVNAKAALAQIASTGRTENGITVSSDFVTGGMFSLDGVHPTPRGYAISANDIITAVNSKYGSTIPHVNIGDYATITASQSGD